MLFRGHIDKNREICYTYDENGNILTKNVNGTVTTYKYQDGTDRLMSFGSESFVYDAMGNPTTYRGMTCTWEKGRQLKSMTSAAGTATFTYDGTGLRKSKTVGNETTSYVYENGRLLRQTGSETIDFIYGSEGVIGFKVGTASYLYRKNLFGDVTEIYNEAGTIVGKYFGRRPKFNLSAARLKIST